MSGRIRQIVDHFNTSMTLSAGNVIKVGVEIKTEHTFKTGQNEQLQKIADDTITYDPNEIIDKERIFGKQIVDGIVCMAYIINEISNSYEGNILLSQSAKFVNPVYFEEKTTCVIKIVKTVPAKRIYSIDVMIYRPDGVLGVVAKADLMSFNKNVIVE